MLFVIVTEKTLLLHCRAGMLSLLSLSSNKPPALNLAGLLTDKVLACNVFQWLHGVGTLSQDGMLQHRKKQIWKVVFPHGKMWPSRANTYPPLPILDMCTYRWRYDLATHSALKDQLNSQVSDLPFWAKFAERFHFLFFQKMKCYAKCWRGSFSTTNMANNALCLNVWLCIFSRQCLVSLTSTLLKVWQWVRLVWHDSLETILSVLRGPFSARGVWVPK